MNNTLFKLVQIQIKGFVREPEIIFWSLLFPIGISFILGLAFTQRGEAARKVAVIDSASPEAIHSFKERVNPKTFTFITYSEQEALVKLKRGEIQIYIKADSAGRISYHYDPLNTEAHLTYLLLEKEMNPVKNNERTVVEITSKGDRYIDFLIPGLIAMGIMNSCIWGIGYNLIEARIKKLLRRMIATPMKKSIFLTAHMITRLLVTFAEGLILFSFAYFIFGVEIQGSLAALILVYIAGVFAFSGIAILTSSRAENSQVGNGLINAVVLPMTILSGVFFSYHNFPTWIESIVQFFPLTILADNIRAVFNEGAGLSTVFFPVVLLISIGVVTFFSGLRIYKWY